LSTAGLFWPIGWQEMLASKTTQMDILQFGMLHVYGFWFSVISIMCQAFSPAVFKYFYDVHEGSSPSCLTTKWIFQRLVHTDIRWSQVYETQQVMQQFFYA